MKTAHLRSIRIRLLAIGALLIFAGCGDPWQRAAGIVLDAHSGLPLAGVLYGPMPWMQGQENWPGWRDQVKATDSLGRFDWSRIGPTDFIMHFELPGYDILNRHYTQVTEHDTVRMTRK